MKGEAEAFAVEAKAKAEAEQMAKKADAWKDYQDAAMVDMILETLPKVLCTAGQSVFFTVAEHTNLIRCRKMITKDIFKRSQVYTPDDALIN